MTLVPAEPQRPAWIELMGPAGELAGKISETEFVPARLRKRPAAVMACILSGQEAGVGPMQSLRQIFVTDDGKVGMAAELMRSLVLKEGHEIWPEEYNNTRVTMAGRRRGQETPTRVTWTLDDAKKASLMSRRNWQNYPRAMLTARATTELCRLIFADVIAGISYSLEELEDGDVDLGAPPPLEPGGDQPKTNTRKAPAARATRAKKSPAPPPAEPELPGEEPSAPAPASTGGMPTPQKIAMRAREAGIDHHQVVAAVTSGTKTSSMDLTGAEAADVLEAIKAIAEGRRKLVKDPGKCPYLTDVEQDTADDGIEDAELVNDDEPPLPGEEPPAPPRPPVEDWSASDWRTYLEEKGVRMADVLREAYRLAPDYDTVPPVTLEQLAQRKRLAAVMKDYVDGFGRDGDS